MLSMACVCVVRVLSAHKTLTTSKIFSSWTRTRTNPMYVSAKLSLILIHSFCLSRISVEMFDDIRTIYFIIWCCWEMTSSRLFILLFIFCHSLVQFCHTTSCLYVSESMFQLQAVLQCNPLKIKRISIYLLKYQRQCRAMPCHAASYRLNGSWILTEAGMIRLNTSTEICTGTHTHLFRTFNAFV